MKVITPHEIKSTIDCVAKRFEKEVATTSKPAENSTYVTNALDALASSAKAGIGIQRITGANILQRYSGIIKKFTNKEGLREFISNCKDGSKELEDINTLLKHSERSAEFNIFDKKMFNFISKDATIPEAISKDLEILRKPGNIKENYIPIFKTEKDALETAKTGDVFQIQGRKTVAIKNKNGEVEQLSMNRDSYFELFPPVKRFTNIQPDNYGICYEVTSLNAVMENPQTRENILRCIDTISQKGKVKINFPNSTTKNDIIFTPDEIIKEGLEYYSSGCEGIRYIEHALGKEYEKPFIEYQIKTLEESGQTKLAEDIKRLYEWGQHKEIGKLCGVTNKASLGTNLREAGDAIVPWRILGFKENASVEAGDFLSKAKDGDRMIDNRSWLDIYKTGTTITDSEKFAELLWSPEFFKNNLVEAYVGDNNSLSKLSKWHSYRLSPVLDNQGNIESYLIKDPHGTVNQKISFDDIFDTIDSISFAKI
ncbi:MAG: hypothetical protein NC200_07320 [Candidatus Gastranaerophilales bacterium]|nr:hypothetical protein [Candidatus Gastranaerophilales bacterium]